MGTELWKEVGVGLNTAPIGPRHLYHVCCCVAGKGHLSWEKEVCHRVRRNACVQELVKIWANLTRWETDCLDLIELDTQSLQAPTQNGLVP